MTSENLRKAKKLEAEIDKLDSFIRNAESSWTGTIVKREIKYIFKSFDETGDKEYEMNYETKNKVLEVLKVHLKDLKKQLEEL